ncbi:MAG: EAL domain-containing protein [Acidobacteriia bacterium]|nr:EAL domain-containing protein [Terriglobia bacterium]
MNAPLLTAILGPGGLRTRFQPVFEIDDRGQRVYSLECLTRGPEGTLFEEADLLFDYVRRKQAESLVDRECIATALRTYAQFGINIRLGINVHASSLGRDADLATFLLTAAERFAIPATSLMVEVVEHAPAWNQPQFLRNLAALRRAGVCIALDDVGLGRSNYQMILDCLPDVFKLDAYLVHGAHADPARMAVVECLLNLARRLDARVVAEGVDNEMDLGALRDIGMTMFQGNLFCPALSFSAVVMHLQTQQRANLQLLGK